MSKDNSAPRGNIRVQIICIHRNLGTSAQLDLKDVRGEGIWYLKYNRAEVTCDLGFKILEGNKEPVLIVYWDDMT